MKPKRVTRKSLEYYDGLVMQDGEPFTGVAYFLDAERQLQAEIEHQHGLEWGMKREWFRPGQPYYEGRLFLGVLHGKKREWHRNGQLAEEGDYELGFVLRKKRWDENGKVIQEYELKNTDPDYKELEKYRQIYKDALEREKRVGPAE